MMSSAVAALDLNITAYNVNFDNDITAFFASFKGNVNMNDNNITNILTSVYNLTGCEGDQDPGTLCYNVEDDTMQFYTVNGQVIQFGQELGGPGFNDAGEDLPDGTIVALSGAQGDKPTFIRADGSNVSESSLVGVLTIPCSTATICPVIVFGFVRGIDTSMFAEEDKLYINSSSPGEFTNQIPILPNNPEWIATVIKSHSQNGIVFVFPKTDPSDGFLINDIWATGDLTVDGVINSSDGFIDMASPLKFIDGSQLRFGSVTGYTNTSQAITIYNNQTSGEGIPVFIVESKFNGNDELGKLHIAIAKQRNNTVRWLGNSWFVGPENIGNITGESNLFKLLDINFIYGFFNVTPFSNADTSGDGAGLFVQGKLDVWNSVRMLNGLLGFGSFSWTGSGNADFLNMSIHPQELVTFETGFGIGDERVVHDAAFIGTLSPYENTDLTPNVWTVTNEVLCSNPPCAEAMGFTGSSNIEMEANFTTLDVNDTNLQFTYSLDSLIGGDSFEVFVNNNIGSGDVSVFSSSGTVITNSVNVSLGSSFWNVSTVTISVVCDATRSGRDCYYDDVKVNGTSTSDTSANVTGIRSQYCGGNGVIDPATGLCDRALYYDPSDDTWKFIGNLNFTGTVPAGVIGGSGTANKISKFTGDGTSIGNSNLNDNGVLVESDVTLLATQLNSTGGLNVNGQSNLIGNVGIGTATPDFDLDIEGSSTTSRIYGNAGDSIFQIRNDGTGHTSGIQFLRERSTGPGVPGACIGVDSNNATNDVVIVFDVDTSVSCGQSLGAQQRFSIGSNGDAFFGNLDVGIGDSTPDAKLDVEGSFIATGESSLGGVSGDGTGKVVCVKSDGNLGTCTDQPDGSGVCTCS